ncbi:MAG: IPT/TIG domain-containing protein, partial [Dehalococcoidales bacterium]|nr:IPT/TIG domain-containing protein [Dehalococcoidales bacterium]
MKYTGIIRMLVVTLILSLLLMAVPVLPVHATNDTTLSVSTGQPGDTITISGTNFTPSTDTSEKWVNIYFTSDTAVVGYYIDNQIDSYELVGWALIGEIHYADEGEFTTTFTVPSSLTDGSATGTVISGTFYVVVTLSGATLVKSVTQFTVASGALTVSPATGPVDTAVRISGTGFIGGTAITVTYDGTAVLIDSGSTTTGTDGSLDSYIYIPEGVAGARTITVTVGGSDVTATFTVVPDILITPQSGEAGKTVLISCTGFARRAVPTIYFNAYPVETLSPVIADTSGTFSASFLVPEGLNAGVYQVEADDGTNLAVASFTLNVAPPIEPTPEPEPTP